MGRTPQMDEGLHIITLYVPVLYFNLLWCFELIGLSYISLCMLQRKFLAEKDEETVQLDPGAIKWHIQSYLFTIMFDLDFSSQR